MPESNTVVFRSFRFCLPFMPLNNGLPFPKTIGFTIIRYSSIKKLGEAASMTKINQQKLQYGTSIIDYSIVRSRRRKTSEIIVDAENVIIRTPYHKSIEEINDIVRGKANWIRTKQSEYRLKSPEIVKPAFQEGSTLP
jgi:hypothetical protein